MEQELEFLRTKIAVQMAITDRMVEVNCERSPELMDHIVTVVVQSLTKEREAVSWPADWWQAVKDRWFPLWLLKRFPVVWEFKTFSRYCPHIGIPEIWPHAQFLQGLDPIDVISLTTAK